MKNALAGPGEWLGEGVSAAAGAGARWLMGVLRGADPTVSVAGDADGVEERGHRGGGGQDDHRGEQQRQEGDDDGKTGDGGETTHRNLRYIWRATRKRITDHHWYRDG